MGDSRVELLCKDNIVVIQVVFTLVKSQLFRKRAEISLVRLTSKQPVPKEHKVAPLYLETLIGYRLTSSYQNVLEPCQTALAPEGLLLLPVAE
jgi:hypothetical protein